MAGGQNGLCPAPTASVGKDFCQGEGFYTKRFCAEEKVSRAAPR